MVWVRLRNDRFGSVGEAAEAGDLAEAPGPQGVRCGSGAGVDGGRGVKSSTDEEGREIVGRHNDSEGK